MLYLRTVCTTSVYLVRWSGLGDSYSLVKRDGICGMDWGSPRPWVSTPNVLWTFEVCQSQITLLPRYGVIAMTDVMRQWHELCLFVCYLALCRYPLLCVCLHCTVSSAYTSVHNLATHMCHLPYNCHLHSQLARLCHTKVACHIHVSFAPALTETRRSGSFFNFISQLRLIGSSLCGERDDSADWQSCSVCNC